MLSPELLTTSIFVKLALGFGLGAVIGVLAWRANSLNGSGVWAATITGGLVFGLGGLPWAVLLIAFFASSSALSRAFVMRKAAISEKFSKGHRRDWGQVLANGGLGALLALAHGLLPEAFWPWVAFAGAMAAVNADTWATELGVLSPTNPRLVSSGTQVEPGTSGGVTLVGSLAALMGAALIGLGAALFTPWAEPFAPAGPLAVLVAVTLGGFAGSFFDSWLGATVQAIYYCPACKKETERHPVHACGSETQPLRGWSWLNNDWVNFGASLVGAALAVAVWGWVAG